MSLGAIQGCCGMEALSLGSGIQALVLVRAAKIKASKRRACGYGDGEYFFTLIRALEFQPKEVYFGSKREETKRDCEK